MYKLVLYGLLVIAAYGIILDYTRIISLAVLFVACYISNWIFASIFKVPANSESYFITALILFLILSPAATLDEFLILALGGVIAMGSKFIIAPMRKHIFNPAAFAAFVLYISGLAGAIWWAGSFAMLPVVLIVGLLIVRKIRRFHMFFSFLIAGFASIYFFHGVFVEAVISWPTVFFGTVMLTEPLTTPPTRNLRIIYGVLVGILFGSQFHLGPIIPTPEFVLLLGNVFSYITGFKRRVIMTFKEKSELAGDVYEFVFTSDSKINFAPGQYLEWTIFHRKADIRGVRRYFTIASSPTEDEIKLGIKMNNPPSSFKNKLASLESGEKIFAGELAGDFVLPRDKNKKLAFIAGGIGVTPFRSMIKYLSDVGDRRDAVLFYAVKSEEEIAYRYLFIEAESKVGLRTEYVVGRFIDAGFIKDKLPDWHERIFYLSGPEGMVASYKKMLLQIGVSRRNIITDYFPGFA